MKNTFQNQYSAKSCLWSEIKLPAFFLPSLLCISDRGGVLDASGFLRSHVGGHMADFISLMP